MPIPLTTPSQAQVDARGILDFLDAGAHLDLHSIAIARDGAALARGWWAPYEPDRKHLLYSCSKSITATTVAALAGDGVLGLDDPILDLLPAAALASAGDLAPVWQRVTVRHCLTMTVGHTEEAWPGTDLAQEPLHTILRNPPDAEPGSVFAYNQVATYLLSRAVENVTGKRLADVALERVLSRIGVTDLDWETEHAGHTIGFTGARLRTDDLLSLAQLWLDRGTSGDHQIVPAVWFDEAPQPFLPADEHSASDWEHGYGHSFWVARNGYRADGAFGQYGVVLPQQRVVVAITSEVMDMQEVLDLLWQHLLPAIDRASSPEADAELEHRLASLSIPALGSTAATGEFRSWALDPASDLDVAYTAVAVSDDGATLTLTRHGQALPISVGDGAWVEGELSADGHHVPVLASGGWDDQGYTAVVRLIETPHRFQVRTGPAGALLRWHLPPLRTTDPVLTAVR